MTSRVRCSCGRVYDPAKHTTCPACGAESAVESVVVAEKIKGPVPPDLNRESAQSDTAEATQTKGTREGRTQLFDLLKTLPWPLYAGAVAFILVLLFFALRPHHPKQVAKKKEVPLPPPVSQQASATPGFTVPPSGGPTIPPSIVTSGVNLAELIANAKPGATITMPAGLYPGGLVVSQAVRIVGDSGAGGQVVIQGEGKECLSVRAKGVSVQNVQFWCKGIGELPAVSVADGADLQMEGCKIDSSSALGLLVSGNASIKALGSGFAAAKGTAARITKQAQASFTQCSFSNSQIGLAMSNAAKTELHSCAFEGIGVGDSGAAIMLVADKNTQLTGDDCQFTNNRARIDVSDAASMTLTGCTFKQNVGSTTGGGVGTGVVTVSTSAQVVIRNSTMTNSSPYAIDVMGGGTLTLEDSEISGSRTAGLVVGERNAPVAHADVKRSRFLGNATGIGVFGGSTADVQDSECRENNDGIVVFDQGSGLKLTKTNVVSNRDHGLYAYDNSEVTVLDSNFQNNGRGALSGTPRKSSQRASIRLENCRFGGNRVFGAGASTHSELVLANCAFDGTDKTNVYHERGAVVQTEGLAGDPDASPEPTEEESSTQSQGKHKTGRHRYDEQRRHAEDVSRIIRRFLPGR
jgi:hypothetical protein